MAITPAMIAAHIPEEWQFWKFRFGNGVMTVNDAEDNYPGTMTNTGEAFDFSLPLTVNGNPVGGGVDTTGAQAGEYLKWTGSALDWDAPAGSGTVTSVAVDGGTTGLTTSGGPITGAGTLTLGGTLNVANGGTGAATAADARTNLGLGGAAVLNVGTITGTVAAGDHTHDYSSVYAASNHNHSGVYANATHTHASTDVTGLGGAALLNVGTAAGTVAAGDHTHAASGAPTGAKYIVQEAHSDLSAEQSLGALTTGLLLNTVSASVGTLSKATLGGDFGAPKTVATYTAASSTVAAGVEIALVDATSNAVTLTLPAANEYGSAKGRTVTIIRIDTTSNTVTVQRAGSDVIDSAATSFVLVGRGSRITLVSDGSTTWYDPNLTTGHHPGTGFFNPATYGFLAWNYPNIHAVTASTAGTSDRLYLKRIWVPRTIYCTGLAMFQTGTIGTPSGDNKAVLYSQTGAQLAITADLGSATWNTTGFKKMAWTSPVTIAGGPGVWVLAGITCKAGTRPGFACVAVNTASTIDMLGLDIAAGFSYPNSVYDWATTIPTQLTEASLGKDASRTWWTALY